MTGKKVTGDTIAFKFNYDLPAGVYRLYISDSVFIDYIIARDHDIRMRTTADAFSDSLRVIKGDDNIKYYDYIAFRNTGLKKLSELTLLIKPDGTKKTNPLAGERISFLEGCITYKIKKFADSLIVVDTSAFVSKLIKAQLVPNLNIEMLEHSDCKFYNNTIEFLLFHFFDNIDFSDARFLNTEIFYRTVKYYIEELVLPRNVTGFNYGNEFILKKAAANLEVRRYVLSVLFGLYEYSQLEDVYLDLYDNYLSKDTLAVTSVRLKEIKQKIEIIKKLSQGNIAPEISGKDTLGNEINLSSVKAEIIVLFLWMPGNKHSEEAMVQLGDIYTKYKEYGLEVYSFALDSSAATWKKSLQVIKQGWIDVSDLKGSQSPVCNNYNTWSLPGIYILDENRKISVKPMNMDYVKTEFGKYDKK
ncbi:MAG: redoxin domain-containing protein [Bacteroidota bacterium]